MAILPSVGNMRNFRGINDNIAGLLAELEKVRKKSDSSIILTVSMIDEPVKIRPYSA